MNTSIKITILDWDGVGVVRIPDAASLELEVDVGDSLYLIAKCVGNIRCLILSKTPKILDRIDELTEWWDSNPTADGSQNNLRIAGMLLHSTKEDPWPRTAVITLRSTLRF